MSEATVGDGPTAEQAAAIGTRDRDVFCEAGAGTGKTRVLVGRYCGALLEDGAEIDEILAFTFTERAAAELRRRIRRELASRGERSLARETERAWVTTIHGFCRRLLGAHPVAAGLDPRFRVLDAPEAARLRAQAAREALNALVVDGDDTVRRVTAAYRPWRMQEIALMAHERLRSQGMAHPRLPNVGEPKRSHKDDDSDLTPQERQDAIDARAALDAVLAELHRRYEDLKRIRSGLDFSDLELQAVELLRASPAVSAQWRGRFKHLMVDEFQDTNRVQLDLVAELRAPDTRLFRVGDEHQSIYRFRNADLEVFRAERRRAEGSPTTEVLPLRGNFRSRPPILAAANAFGETLLEGFTPLTVGEGSRQAETGAPRVELLLTYNEGSAAKHVKWRDHEATLKLPPSERTAANVAQARALAERLRELVDSEGVSRGDIVVLLRAFTHVDAYEEALRRYGLEPYVVGGRGYWSQQQVEDLLRLLGVVANPLDDEMIFGALASPAVGVSPDTLWLLRAAAGRGHVWPAVEIGFGSAESGDFDLAEPDRLGQILEDDARKLEVFCERLRPLRAEAPLLPLDSLVERTMNAFGYDLALLARSQPAGRMANVRKLMRLAREFEQNEGRDLRTFLVQAAESTKRDEREGLAPVQAEDHDGVRIMTVHGAKGLEFPVVAVPELDRPLDVGHRSADIWIGRVGAEGEPPRFGLRLAFPTAKSLGVWELAELDREEKEAEAEESCRLVYVAMTRAEERLILSGAYKPKDIEESEPKSNDTALSRFLPRLAAAGWDGTDGPVEAPVPLRVRVSRPGEERATVLTPSTAVSEPLPDDAPDVAPPILEAGRSVVPLGHLSYSALDAFKRCGYRFYIERVLGVRPGLVSAPTASDEEEGEAAEDEARVADELHEPEDSGVTVGGAGPSPALALGNAVHAALEWSARTGWERPGAERLGALLAREGVRDDEVLSRATRLVDGWLGSKLLAGLDGARVRPEAPFVLPLGGTVLRGSIDLLVVREAAGNGTGDGNANGNGGDKGNGATVVDFKTDRVGSGGVGVLGDRYASQRAVYALAAAGAANGGVVTTAHVFLERPDEPVVEVFGEAALTAARASLEGLIARIRAGSFEVTPEPYAALCFGCPAAPRLCPHPAWRPGRDAPAAVR
ncbi:MAG: UvrD-helicase domain-containing protein [Solirubrobacterales bacterium]